MIRLSKLADYGIVIVTHLARESGRSTATHEIAAATSVPVPMASKILKLLAKADILASQRGAHGGYELARPAASISVAEVIEALDGPIAITSCAEHGPADCLIEQLCPARTNWQHINEAIRGALGGISVAEMAYAIPAGFLTSAERLAGGASAPRGLTA